MDEQNRLLRPPTSPTPVASRPRPRWGVVVAVVGRSPLVDAAALTHGWKQVVRVSIPASAVLLPVAYFLSVASPQVGSPTRLINLAYVGGLSLTIGTLTLGVGSLAAS